MSTIGVLSENRRCFLFLLLLLPVIVPVLTSPAHAITSSINVIENHSFEQGLVTPAPQVLPSLPNKWGNWTKHGTPDSTITVDTTRAIDGRNSTRMDIGQTQTGFIAIFQSLPSTLHFGNLSDRPDGLDFWFYLEPKYSGMGDFRVRILYGENVAELNYVFDPWPGYSYPNVTDPETGQPEQVSIFLTGYPAGMWHHFQRNLRADWTAPVKLPNGTFVPGYSLDIPFPRIQFDALAFKDIETGEYFAERVWIDKVKVYRDVETPAHWLSFNFQDQAQNNIALSIEWKLFNSSGKSFSYQMGAITLPEEPFTLEVYYPSSTGQQPEPFRIHTQTIDELDRLYTIILSMAANPYDPGAYVASDAPAQLSDIQENSTAITFTASGTAGAIILRVPSRPTVILRNGLEISETTWSHYPAYGVVRISTGTPGRFALLFATPLRLPTIISTDAAGNSVDSIVEMRILTSLGGPVQYTPGGVVPEGTYRLEFYYEGYRVHTSTLEPSTDTGATLSIQLSMLPISSAQSGYLAVNVTHASITILQQSDQRLTFKIDGDGPVLLVAKVSKKPLYIELDGRRVFWSYNSTTQTASVESETRGTFSLVMAENTGLLGIPTVYLAGTGAAAALVVGTVAVLLFRRNHQSVTRNAAASRGRGKVLTEPRNGKSKNLGWD